jgi:hypothetical protein
MLISRQMVTRPRPAEQYLTRLILVQPIAGVMQETQKRILEVRWLPPRADDRSKAVDLKPGE